MALSGESSRAKDVAQALPVVIYNESDEAFNANPAEVVEPQARSGAGA
jgi:hypothetical protein